MKKSTIARRMMIITSDKEMTLQKDTQRGRSLCGVSRGVSVPRMKDSNEIVATITN